EGTVGNLTITPVPTDIEIHANDFNKQYESFFTDVKQSFGTAHLVIKNQMSQRNLNFDIIYQKPNACRTTPEGISRNAT
ncbi:hypothetical protein CEXT_720081, partial [Caerostris extrusa]